MGFFEDLGRKVEEFKQTATDAAAEETSHECRNCGERFFADHDECPACGAEAVVSRTDPDSPTSAPESADGPAVESGGDDSSVSTESASRDGSSESASRDGSSESASRDGSSESDSLD